MVQLSPSQFPTAYALYLSQEARFPLIAAVLLNEQEGVVHVDREESPAQIYVEHAFGFAQVFGTPVPAFEWALQRHLLIDKTFSCVKVRLYTPHYPEFLRASEYDSLRSWRQHFRLGMDHSRSSVAEPPENTRGRTLVHADASHVDLIEGAFGLMGRFWRTPQDFVTRSNAVLAFVDGLPAALCYAAAVAGGMAEIDVVTLPSYRHLGLGKAVVSLFNDRCLAQNILPLWDCFTNNAASMALCESTGFVPTGDPYPFFTINR